MHHDKISSNKENSGSRVMRLILTCWLINSIAMSFRSGNSSNAASIDDTCVSVILISNNKEDEVDQLMYKTNMPTGRGEEHELESTTRKFFFCCSFTCPIPAKRSPVILS